jgi:hypothetical protein
MLGDGSRNKIICRMDNMFTQSHWCSACALNKSYSPIWKPTVLIWKLCCVWLDLKYSKSEIVSLPLLYGCHWPNQCCKCILSLKRGLYVATARKDILNRKLCGLLRSHSSNKVQYILVVADLVVPVQDWRRSSWRVPRGAYRNNWRAIDSVRLKELNWWARPEKRRVYLSDLAYIVTS